MKKIMLCCIIVLCFNVIGSAQKARVGVSGGVSYANITSSVNGSKESGNQRVGSVFGIFVDAPVTKHISFLPGVFYVQKGMNQKVDVNTPNIKTSYALRYVELNGNFVFNTNGPKVNLYGGAGPSFGMNLPSKKVINTSGTKVSTELTFGNEASEDFKSIDWGANFIVGMRFPCGAFISFNYNQGFANIAGPATENTKTHNNYIGAQIGILVKNNK